MIRLFCFLVAMVVTVHAADLEKLTGVRLVESPANDGDSFIVKGGDRELHLRLYFVDCPETVVSTDADSKRVREQAGYFGLTNVVKVITYGKEAQAFTAKKLAKPFTVYTSYADAMGRSPTQRFYAFIITADGKDLACELVENGLARAYGTKRATPNGTTAAEMDKRLHDLEIRAMLKHVGAWKDSDADEIVRERAAHRAEEEQLADLRRQIEASEKGSGPVNLNTATSRQLQGLPGIGPALAEKIIAGRPYRSVDDLARVRGIGSKLFVKLRPLVTVKKEAPTP